MDHGLTEGFQWINIRLLTPRKGRMYEKLKTKASIRLKAKANCREQL
jgi:hypothetical protein